MTLIAAAYALEKLAAGRAPKPMRLIAGETRISEVQQGGIVNGTA